MGFAAIAGRQRLAAAELDSMVLLLDDWGRYHAHHMTDKIGTGWLVHFRIPDKKLQPFFYSLHVRTTDLCETNMTFSSHDDRIDCYVEHEKLQGLTLYTVALSLFDLAWLKQKESSYFFRAGALLWLRAIFS